MVYAGDVNILGVSAHKIKDKIKAWLVGSKETGLEVNADETKYMLMSRDRKQNKIAIYRLIKNGRVKIFGNNPKESKCLSERN